MKRKIMWAWPVLLILCSGTVFTASSSARVIASAEYCGSIEAFAIKAEGNYTSCDFALDAGRKVRDLAFHHHDEFDNRFRIRVNGHPLTCRNFYYHRVETILCLGHHRKVRLQYEAP